MACSTLFTVLVCCCLFIDTDAYRGLHIIHGHCLIFAGSAACVPLAIPCRPAHRCLSLTQITDYLQGVMQHNSRCRSAHGGLSLREVTGSVLVGQQQPLMTVPDPQSDVSAALHVVRLVGDGVASSAIIIIFELPAQAGLWAA
jgi:hypothetical protein